MNWEELKKYLIDSKYHYFHTDNGVLLCGDCLEIMKMFPENSIDLILTDPPFGCNATMKGDYNDNEEHIKQLIPLWLDVFYKVLKANSYVFIYVPTLYIENWIIPFKNKFKFLNILAVENMKVGRQYKDRFRYNLQLILVGSKGKPKGFNKISWIKTSESWLKDKRNPNPRPYTSTYPSYIPNYYKATVERSVGHPDEKNWKLIEKFIQITTNENEIVLDCFSGSGSTLVACEKSNRKWIGIEISPKYCEIAKQRIIKESQKSI